MRIISGLWRGQPLRVPKGVRPTTDKVRESIFSILGDAAGLRILDLYAGSGSLGIEALSRGASSVCFVDIAKNSLDTIRNNLGGKSADGVLIIRQRGIEFLKKTKDSFDWIFCDPPYDNVDLVDLTHKLVASIAVGQESLIILETDCFHRVDLPLGLVRVDERKFGDTLIHFIKRPESTPTELHRA
jgi:16S rRNA (guanine966-N2)-methyltransferase